jgi:hypothetical protein
MREMEQKFSRIQTFMEELKEQVEENKKRLDTNEVIKSEEAAPVLPATTLAVAPLVNDKVEKWSEPKNMDMFAGADELKETKDALSKLELTFEQKMEPITKA